MSAVPIDQIANHDGQEATVRGWVFKKRSSGKIQFLVVRDGTGYLQVVLVKKEISPDAWEAAESVGQESSLSITGTIRKDDRAPGGYEMSIADLSVIHEAQDYPIQPKGHGVEFLLELPEPTRIVLLGQEFDGESNKNAGASVGDQPTREQG